MTMTRTELTLMARELADAVDSPRWSDATIQGFLGLAQWTELGKLLNANNQYYMNGPITVTPDSDGLFDIADLTTGSADAVKNFYRVMTLGVPSGGSGTSGPLYYRESTFTEFPNPQPSTSLLYVWYRFGSQIQVLPAQSAQTLQAVVNYRPCRVENLAADASDVPFPDGYETMLAYLAGAMMLDKGGAEAGAANVLLSNAEGIRNDMMLDLGRMSTSPVVARSFDTRADWGG